MAKLSTSRKPPNTPKSRPAIRVDLVTAEPRDRWLRRLVLVLLASLAIHFISFQGIVDYGARHGRKSNPVNQPITIRMVPPELTQEQKDILSARQQKTEKPKEASHLGDVDHIAKQETRTRPTMEKNLDQEPGRVPGKKEMPSTPANQQPNKQVAKTKPAKPGKGKLEINNAAQSAYTNLMPTASELAKQMDAGYVGYINDKVALGDAVDINTTEFRFIGYFTAMRKSIELVWNYPYDAAVRGMQGTVGIVFTINKDGTTEKIKILNSSGFKVLDQAIVDAVTLASPFGPLPPSFNKEKLTIRGNFTYRLAM